jgi:hypothetical protein
MKSLLIGADENQIGEIKSIYLYYGKQLYKLRRKGFLEKKTRKYFY